MLNNIYRKVFAATSFVTGLSMAMAGMTGAASTTKNLSTNFTLVNFGLSTANVTAYYYNITGTTWSGVPTASQNFTITANGGQLILRQYDSAHSGMSSGKGSVSLSSDQALGAVVQIRVTPGMGTETSGAYNGFGAANTSSTFYVPLVSRKGSSANGTTNSQIIIQNTKDTTATVSVVFNPLTGFGNAFTKTAITIAPFSSYYYDLDDEASLTAPWFGSAVVSAPGGQIAVVSNFFTGPDAMQTFNAFPSSAPGTAFFVPLFASKLGNGLNSPVSVQNLSGGELPAGALTLFCKALAGTPATLTLTNTAAVANNASANFNPVTDPRVPTTAWYGSCKLTSTGNVVAFVQMRYISGTPSQAAAHEAINANGTDKKAFIPLIAKHLGNGFATAVTLQNLANVTATVTLEYKGTSTITSTVQIGPESSLVHNQRLSSFFVNTAGDMADGWIGTLTATSNQPIHGFVQLTYWNGLAGDTFQAHNAFTQP